MQGTAFAMTQLSSITVHTIKCEDTNWLDAAMEVSNKTVAQTLLTGWCTRGFITAAVNQELLQHQTQ